MKVKVEHEQIIGPYWCEAEKSWLRVVSTDKGFHAEKAVRNKQNKSPTWELVSDKNQWVVNDYDSNEPPVIEGLSIIDGVLYRTDFTKSQITQQLNISIYNKSGNKSLFNQNKEKIKPFDIEAPPELAITPFDRLPLTPEQHKERWSKWPKSSTRNELDYNTLSHFTKEQNSMLVDELTTEIAAIIPQHYQTPEDYQLALLALLDSNNESSKLLARTSARTEFDSKYQLNTTNDKKTQLDLYNKKHAFYVALITTELKQLTDYFKLEQPAIAIDWYQKLRELGIDEAIIPKELSNETYAGLYERVQALKLIKVPVRESWELKALTGITEYYFDIVLLKGKGENRLAHYAALSGNPGALAWIKANAPKALEVKDNNGNTIAHYAAYSGKPEALDWVKTNAPELLDVKGNEGSTIAHYAAQSGKPEALAWVKDNAPGLLGVKNKYGSTIAHIAALSGKLKALAWVKANAAELLGVKNNAGDTIAHYAALSGKPEALAWVKDNAAELLGVKNNAGDTIAHSAARSGKPEALAWVKANAAELLGVKNNAGDTIAHYAALSGKPEALAWVKDNAAELLGVKNNAGDTIAHYAALSGKPEALAWVKANAAELLGVKNNGGFTIAHSAARSGKPEALAWVKANAAELLGVKDNVGDTIAHSAARSGKPEALAWVKDNAPELLGVKNNNGTTIAHYAAGSGKPEALDWVKDNAPELLGVKNNNGSTIAHIAAQSGKPEALAWVKDNAPELLGVKNNNGTTIAHIAAQHGKPEALAWVKANAPELLQVRSWDDVYDTITHSAVQSGKPEVLDWIKANAPELLGVKNNDGSTIAHYAAQYGKPKALAWVKTNAPELLGVKNNDGSTIASIARYQLKHDVLEWIIINTPHIATIEDKSYLAQQAANSGSIEQLNNVLSQIKNSEQLTISINGKIKKTIIETLAATLKVNSTLESLTIHDVNSKEDLEPLIEALKDNINLFNIRFVNTTMSEMDRATIDSLLERNRKIHAKYLKPLVDNYSMAFKLLYDMKADLPDLGTPDSIQPMGLNNFFKDYIDAYSEIPLNEHPQLKLSLLSSLFDAKEPIAEFDELLAQSLFVDERNPPAKYHLILWLLRDKLNAAGYQNIVNTCVLKLKGQSDKGSMLLGDNPPRFVHRQQILDVAQKLVIKHAPTKLFNSVIPGELLTHDLIRKAMDLSDDDKIIIVDEERPLKEGVASSLSIVKELFLAEALKHAATEATQLYGAFIADKGQDNRGAKLGLFTRFRHGEAGLEKANQFNNTVQNHNDCQEVITQYLALLNDPNTRFKNHSYATYLLDELQSILEIDPALSTIDKKNAAIEKLESLLPPKALDMGMR